MEAIGCCRPLGALTWRDCRQPRHLDSRTQRERSDGALGLQSHKTGTVSSSSTDILKTGRRSTVAAERLVGHVISLGGSMRTDVHAFGGSSALGGCASGTQGLSSAPLRRNGTSRGRVVCGLFGLGVPEIAVIAGVALVLFGPKKLPEVGKSLGKTVKSFQEAAKEFESELKSASSESPESAGSDAEQAPAGTKTDTSEKV